MFLPITLGFLCYEAGFNLVLNSCESFLSWQSNESGLGYDNELDLVWISDHMKGWRKASTILLSSVFCAHTFANVKTKFCERLYMSFVSLIDNDNKEI